MQTTLLIMAAGIGSRFGGGIKQLEPVDEQGHIIMDYSIHDAIEAGFNKVVFIIRKDIENEFKDVIGNRIEAVCKAHSVTVEYERYSGRTSGRSYEALGYRTGGSGCKGRFDNAFCCDQCR